MLRTLNYPKHKSNTDVDMPFICSGSFDTLSTMTNDHHNLFYSDISKCRIHMTKTKPEVTWFSSLFQQIDYLIIEMPIICYSIWDFFPSISKNNI